jgi:hypothetical protein
LYGPFLPEIPHQRVTANNGRGELVMKNWNTYIGGETTAKTLAGALAMLIGALCSGERDDCRRGHLHLKQLALPAHQFVGGSSHAIKQLQVMNVHAEPLCCGAQPETRGRSWKRKLANQQK